MNGRRQIGFGWLAAFWIARAVWAADMKPVTPAESGKTTRGAGADKGKSGHKKKK